MTLILFVKYYVAMIIISIPIATYFDSREIRVPFYNVNLS